MMECDSDLQLYFSCYYVHNNTTVRSINFLRMVCHLDDESCENTYTTIKADQRILCTYLCKYVYIVLHNCIAFLFFFLEDEGSMRQNEPFSCMVCSSSQNLFSCI